MSEAGWNYPMGVDGSHPYFNQPDPIECVYCGTEMEWEWSYCPFCGWKIDLEELCDD